MKPEEILKLTKQCFFNVDKRRSKYDYYQSMYYTDNDNNVFKTVFGELSSVNSLIFSPENIILDSQTSAPLQDKDAMILAKIVDVVKANFFDNRLDVKMAEIVLNSLKDGTSFVKVIWKNNSVEYVYINPKSIGFLYEGLPIDDKYQVFAHETMFTERALKDQFPQALKLFKGQDDEFKSTLGIKLSGAPYGTKGTLGTIHKLSSNSHIPNAGAPVYPVRELWYFEGTQWYRAIIAAGKVLRNTPMGVRRHSFFAISPYPVINNIWGLSLIEMIGNIQNKQNKLMNEIEGASELLIHPPLILQGAQVMKEEAQKDIKELRKPNGLFIVEGQNTKVEPYLPRLDLPSVFSELNVLTETLEKITSVNEIMMGHSAKNVRSKGYAGILAQFGAAPLKKTAHIIEAQLEAIFTYTGQLFQANDTVTYITDNNDRTFILSQYSAPYRIEIFAHTSSPISNNENIQIMFDLSDKGIIPPILLVDVLPIPYKEQIKRAILKKEEEIKMNPPQPVEPPKKTARSTAPQGG